MGLGFITGLRESHSIKTEYQWFEVSNAMLGIAKGLCGEKILRQIREIIPFCRSSFYNEIFDDLRTTYSNTVVHCVHTAYAAMNLCSFLSLDEEYCIDIAVSALLHDIGKAYVPPEILYKPCKLDACEFKIVQLHPEIGTLILSNWGMPQNIVRGVSDHHERWDGKGYPDGLSGTDISLQGRIIALCDAVDAMHMNRFYREGMQTQQIIREVERCSGSQFDPALAEIFLKNFDEIYNIETNQPLK